MVVGFRLMLVTFRAGGMGPGLVQHVKARLQGRD